jgi:hypothetical protein
MPVWNQENVSKWTDRVRNEVLNSVVQGLIRISPELQSANSADLVRAETATDLETSIDRILKHNLPLVATADELFQWHHYVRYRPSSQVLFLRAKWNPLSPPMSMRFLRLVSKIHPARRLRRRLMNSIIQLPELRAFASIPSAQIPWVGSLAPALIRELIWGFRFQADMLLTARAIRKRDATKRMRLLRTFDPVAEYRSADALDSVASWFSDRWIKRENFVRMARNRGALAVWPHVSIDIGLVANVSMMLDLCFPE